MSPQSTPGPSVPPGHGSELSGSAPQALPLTPAEDRRWATIAHFFGCAGFVPSLIIHLVYRDRGPFTAQESKEAFNFTLPLSVVVLALFGLGFIPVVGWIFLLLAVGVWIFMTISGVVGGVEANKGRPYLYRLNVRLF